MKLYLMRHGLAAMAGDDKTRPLTSMGREDVKRIAEALKARRPGVTLIWHSSRERAAQTADLVRSVLNTKARCQVREDLNPYDSASPVMDAVEVFSEESGRSCDLMIVGHMPFLATLAADLLKNSGPGIPLRFQEASVVCLEREGYGRWKLFDILHVEAL